VTAESYLYDVAYELRDLPWRMRRDLIADVRAHLAELPSDTNLEARLGTPRAYAAELRSAAGLERRRGLIALLRARRPRNLVLAALALTLVGLAIGAVEWVDSYQPIATGNSGYGPLGGHTSPAGDGSYVIVRNGRRFRYGMTIWNSGRYTVRVLGIPMWHLPASYRLLLSTPTTFAEGGWSGPFTRFRPFDLRPGEQRGLVFSGVYDEPCPEQGSVSTSWGAIPVRFSFLWQTKTVQIPLPESVAFLQKSSDCR
jgi:hypothetical protein